MNDLSKISERRVKLAKKLHTMFSVAGAFLILVAFIGIDFPIYLSAFFSVMAIPLAALLVNNYRSDLKPKCPRCSTDIDGVFFIGVKSPLICRQCGLSFKD
jgi:hypothetical protein